MYPSHRRDNIVLLYNSMSAQWVTILPPAMNLGVHVAGSELALKSFNALV